jgi:uncharacterized protein (DUF433 family)/DNA-binding transcriptional MerR regulator
MPKGAPTTPFVGIYQVPEAARYLLGSRMASEVYPVSSRRLIWWVRRGLVLPSLAEVPGRELLITFQDLISMRIIAALRAAGVSWRKIYVAERWLREQTRQPRPFATELLWTERSDVFAEFQRQLIAASRHGQLAMDLLRTYLIPVRGLTFGRDQVVRTWEPQKGILLDPLIQFGAPCIRGTRIPARAVWGMVRAGDSVEFVRRSYGIAEDELEAAISWEDALAA